MFEPTILKQSDTDKLIQEYNKLIDKLDRTSPRYKHLCTSIKNKIKGILGEKDTAFHLQYLSQEFLIIHDIKLLTGNASAQIDHVVLSPYGIFLIDTKNWSDEIEVSSKGEWYRIVEDTNTGKKKNLGVQSPLNQLYRHKEVLNRFIKKFQEDNNIDLSNLPISSIVGMANIITNLSNIDNDYIVKTDALARTIKEHVEKNFSNGLVNSDDLMKFGKFLLENDLTESNLLKLLNVKESELIQQITFEDGTTASTPVEWIKAADKHWNECAKQLKSGRIYNWLLSMGYSQEVEDMKKLKSTNANIVLEKFLTNNPWLSLPKTKIVVSPERIQVEGARYNETTTYEVHVSKEGRGYIYGTIETSYSDKVLFHGDDSILIPIDVEPRNATEVDRVTEDELIIYASGQTFNVPVTISHKFPWLDLTKNSLLPTISSTIFLTIIVLGFLEFISIGLHSISSIMPVAIIALFLLFYFHFRRSFLGSIIYSIVLSTILMLLIDSISLYTFVLYFSFIGSYFNLDDGGILNYPALLSKLLVINLIISALIIGLPQSAKKLNRRYISLCSYSMGSVLILVIGIVSYSNLTNIKTAIEASAASIIVNEEQLIYADFLVHKVTEDDIGQQALYLNPTDFNNLDLIEGQTVAIISETKEILLPVYIRDHVILGYVRMELAIRNTLNVDVNDGVRIQHVTEQHVNDF